ncbi:MAG TPA: hypothetical protein VNQ76_15280 [Planctomicrobium sp.]|nr:hypothetical protein [Planctomicrobium sp.]
MEKVIEVKMARTSSEEIHAVHDFLQDLESVLHTGYYTNQDHEDVIVGNDPEGLSKFIEKRFPKVSACYTRVLMNTQTLLDNCSDPDSETLEWRPDIKALMEARNAAAEVEP